METAVFSNTIENSWVILIIAPLLVVLAWISFHYRETMKLIVFSPVRLKASNGLSREKSEIYNKVSTFINLVFVIIIPLAAVLLYQQIHFSSSYSIAKVLSFAYGAFISIIIVRLVVVRLLGWIFRADTESKAYNFNILLGYKVLGILMIPTVLILAYGSELTMKIALVVSALLILQIFIRRFILGVSIGFSINSFPKIYSMLYICTLEILPILIVVKLFWDEFSTLVMFLK